MTPKASFYCQPPSLGVKRSKHNKKTEAVTAKGKKKPTSFLAEYGE